jgi:hypothetical protein
MVIQKKQLYNYLEKFTIPQLKLISDTFNIQTGGTKKKQSFIMNIINFKNDHVGGGKGHNYRVCYTPKLNFSLSRHEDGEKIWEGAYWNEGDEICSGKGAAPDGVIGLSPREQNELADDIIGYSTSLQGDPGRGRYRFDDAAADRNQLFNKKWLRDLKPVGTKGRNTTLAGQLSDKGFYVTSRRVY